MLELLHPVQRSASVLIRSIPACCSSGTLPWLLAPQSSVFRTWIRSTAVQPHTRRRTWDWEQEHSERVERNEETHLRHSGKERPGAPDLPVHLNLAVNRILLRFDPHLLRTDAKEFLRQIRNRVPAPDARDVRLRAKQLEREYINQKGIDDKRSKMSDAVRMELRSTVEDEVMPKLRNEFYHWKPIVYTPYKAALYLATRFTTDYAILRKIYMEIRKRRPDFVPESLFDFGAGTGSATFPAKEIWNDSIREYMLVDSSPDMIETVRDIVENGKGENKPILEKVHYRHFTPGSMDRPFDVVVCAFTLMDVGSTADRLKLVRTLWGKTNRFLIFVELGNSLGFRTIIEARDHVLGVDRLGRKPRGNAKIDEVLQGASVFAPCSHDDVCPRLADSSDPKHVSCRFPVSYQPLPFMTARHMPKTRDTFSYVVLERDQPQGGDNSWPRIVEPVMLRKRHAICRMCCPDGKLKELNATKHQNKDTYYTTVRHSRWGDRLPLVATETAREMDSEEISQEVEGRHEEER